MPTIPCPTKINQCPPCNDDPIENFSSEAPDLNRFVGNLIVDPPPLRFKFVSPSCLGICWSDVSQEEADACARELAQFCVFNPGTPPPPPPPLWPNDPQVCTVSCPDGSLFSWSVRAGAVHSLWPADANARAYALACKRAASRRICFSTNAQLPPGCVAVPYNTRIHASGGRGPILYEMVSGSLPPGLSFVPELAMVIGLPTVAGQATFSIKASDSSGASMTKEFTLRMVDITSPTVLPEATIGSPYSYQMLSAGTIAPVLWQVSQEDGLPDGLLMSASGLISGTPTGPAGESLFEVAVSDEKAACAREFSLTAVAMPAPSAYWKLDSWSPIGGGFSQTADVIAANDLNDLNAAGSILDYIAPGKINLGVGPLPDFINFGDNGPLPPLFDINLVGSFTVRLWLKIAGPLTDSLLAEHRSVWQLWGVGATQKLQFRVGNTPFFGYDTVNSSVVFSQNVWHRVVIWRDLANGVVGIAVDDGAPDTAPITQLLGPSDYLFFGPTDSTPQAFYDEIGYWIGTVLSASNRHHDWNNGNGRSWPP